MRIPVVVVAALIAGLAVTARGRVAAQSVVTSDRPFAVWADSAMARMHRDWQAAPRSGNVDCDFAALMIPHHRAAVTMAQALLLEGRDPELRRLALKMIADQGEEIARMEAWRRTRCPASEPPASPRAPVSRPPQGRHR